MTENAAAGLFQHSVTPGDANEPAHEGSGNLRLRYDARLVEETVFLALRGHADEEAFHAARHGCYDIADSEERDRVFQQHHTSWFKRLGLGDAVERAFAEQSSIAQRVQVCVVGRAISRKDESAELFVGTPEEGLSERQRRSVGLLLRPQSLLDSESLLDFLRHELFHITDMLSPDFAYEPTLPQSEGGPTYDLLLRNRYRTLWDATIDGRLVRLGWAPSYRREERWRDFVRAFPMLIGETAEFFGHFFDREPHTHAELVSFACDPNAASAEKRPMLQPGSRCALCQFPTYAFEPKPDALPAVVLVQINQDFPKWRPGQGLCPQCADLYRARVTGLGPPIDAEP